MTTVIFRVFIRAFGMMSVPLRRRYDSPAERQRDSVSDVTQPYVTFSRTYRCKQMCLTFVPQVLQVDVQQDAAVAAAHHQQGDDVQRREVEHVVRGFLPAVAEAAVSGALGEVHGLHPDRPEDKQLEGDRQNILTPT